MQANSISIPKPCHENWDAMAPNAQGRFCCSCSKTVTDFTGMTGKEISDYLIANNGKRVCGRFRNKQLTQTPRPEKTFLKKLAIPAFLASAAAWFTSCSKTTEQPDGAHLGEIAVETPKDTVNTTKQYTLGAPMNPDSVTTVMPPRLDSNTLVGEVDPRCIPKDSVPFPPKPRVLEAPKSKPGQTTIPPSEKE